MILDDISMVVYLGYCLAFVFGLLLCLIYFIISCDLVYVLVLLWLSVFVVSLYLIVLTVVFDYCCLVGCRLLRWVFGVIVNCVTGWLGWWVVAIVCCFGLWCLFYGLLLIN